MKTRVTKHFYLLTILFFGVSLLISTAHVSALESEGKEEVNINRLTPHQVLEYYEQQPEFFLLPPEIYGEIGYEVPGAIKIYLNRSRTPVFKISDEPDIWEFISEHIESFNAKYRSEKGKEPWVDWTHTSTCKDCGFTETVNHTLVYVKPSQSDEEHLIKCGYNCGFEFFLTGASLAPERIQRIDIPDVCWNTPAYARNAIENLPIKIVELREIYAPKLTPGMVVGQWPLPGEITTPPEGETIGLCLYISTDKANA